MNIFEIVVIFITSMLLTIIMSSSIRLWIEKNRRHSIILFILLCVIYILVILISEVKGLYFELIILPLYSWWEYRSTKKKIEEIENNRR
ncbi:hypothetical protein [Anaerosacchariphilus polymeriproducens]|uniref:Uncharacterized protein n=1 Tax=Anaerosacchariphilus polymeriproducens TaxID=1812858 RepID=A0A371AXY6_9FIRM|nr:hypothetical protein [Anaerosacchariphilus polymeriproducens]RDU24421.1 hypothetical protein DWV06_02785 [Anaerosacchariphilus polymeriproducens]